MASASTIQTRIDAIEKALATGVLTVRHGETTTTYRSLEEMLKIRADLEDQLAIANGTTRRRLRYVYQSGKGL